MLQLVSVPLKMCCPDPKHQDRIKHARMLSGEMPIRDNRAVRPPRGLIPRVAVREERWVKVPGLPCSLRKVWQAVGRGFLSWRQLPGVLRLPAISLPWVPACGQPLLGATCASMASEQTQWWISAHGSWALGDFASCPWRVSEVHSYGHHKELSITLWLRSQILNKAL